MIKGRLNSKGITLAELIVSFVIVAVAVIYFYQMLTSVTKMYSKARDGIDHSAKVNYAFRLLDEAEKQNKLNNTCNGILSDILVTVGGRKCNVTTSIDDKFKIISFTIKKKEENIEYKLYKYNP